MAIRIPVVVSQSPRRAGSTADFEEQLITRLIFENGLDATLVADLRAIQLDTTDHLCIEGLKGDFAIACWESPAYVCEHLHRLGIPSLVIVPLDGGPKVESIHDGVAPKKVFFIGLSGGSSIDATIESLKSLRDARSIPVVSLGIIKPSKNAGNIRTSTVQSAKEIMAVPTKREEVRETIPDVAFSNDDSEFPNIDELMNDLDKFEL
jgi:hypothetical protein